MLALTVLFPTDAGAGVSSLIGQVHRYAAGAAFILLIVVATTAWRLLRRNGSSVVMVRSAAVLAAASAITMVATTVNTFFPHWAEGDQWRGIPQRILLVLLAALIIVLSLLPARSGRVLRRRCVDSGDLAMLYSKYSDDLRFARKRQREFLDNSPDMKVQLDDIEAELTYLRLREHRPEHVVEVGCLHGWSTSWILQALRDNGSGVLTSVDLIDEAARRIPPDLAYGRWRFVHGDVRDEASRLGAPVDYLFIDAAHTARFARWYIRELLPKLAPGGFVSVHDVFHRVRPLPFTEGAVVLRWLRRAGIGHFTAAPTRAPDLYEDLMRVRSELGLDEPIHRGQHNPMLFCAVP